MNNKIKTGFAVAAMVALTAGVGWAQTPGTGKGDGSTRSTLAAGDQAVYVPITPCRVVDTRSGGGGAFAPNAQRSYRVYDSPGFGYGSQGGVLGNCGIGTDSIAVEATVTAVGPTANGYFRAWPTGVAAPNATFLNYTRGQNISNTGAISVANAVLDLTVKNFGGTTHYVIDVQGYYAKLP